MRNRMKVVAALAEVAIAEGRAADIAKAEYPVGAHISWERGGGVQYGKIEITSFHNGPRFRVRNDRTGKSYWIDFFDVIRAAGDKAVDHYFEARRHASAA